MPASDLMPYSHGHGLDSIVEMVATAASANVSNVGMVGTEAGLGMQNAVMKVQWHGLLSSPHLNPRHPFLLTASTRWARQTRRPSPKRTYTSSASNASSCSVIASASQGIRFPSTTPSQSRSPPPDHRSPYTHQARSTRRLYPNPSPRRPADSVRDA